MSKDIENGFLRSIVKGVFATVIITLGSVLIFAVVIKFTTLDGGVIKVVNQFIKMFSVFLGCIVCVHGSAGILKGGFTGLLSTIAVYGVFALLCGGMNFDLGFVLDLFFGLIVGAISGIISVNVKKT